MLFFLTIISDVLGVFGGFIMAYFVLGLDPNQYWHSSYQRLEYDDIEMGLIKPLLFGFVIATVGCYYGLTAKGGTQGVGRATTQAMVTASVLILLVNLLITKLLLVLT
jgi:phospholipid/cholesterol/gamma-HCH transport system permease protein